MLRSLVICLFMISIGDVHGGNGYDFDFNRDFKDKDARCGFTENPLVTVEEITGKIFLNERIEGPHMNPLKVNMLGSITGTVISDEKNVNCILLNATELESNNLTAKHITKTFFRAPQAISNNVMQGKTLSDIFFSNEVPVNVIELLGSGHTLSLTSNSIEKNILTGDIIDGVYMFGKDTTGNSIKGEIVKRIFIYGQEINNTHIDAKETIYNVYMIGNKTMDRTTIGNIGATSGATENIDNVIIFNPGRIDRTEIAAVRVYGIFCYAHTDVSRTRISGENLRQISLFSSILVNNDIRSTSNLSDIEIGAGDTIQDLYITSVNLQHLVVNSTDSDKYTRNIKNVQIRVQDSVNGVYVNDVRADDVVEPSHPTYNARHFEMLCDDANGCPQDPELKGRCYFDYCRTMCSAKGYQKGKCCGPTCCCINDKAF